MDTCPQPLFTQSLRSFSDQPILVGLHTPPPPPPEAYHPLSFPAVHATVNASPTAELDTFIRQLSSFPKPLTSLEAPLPGVHELLSQEGSPARLSPMSTLPPVEPMATTAPFPHSPPPPAYHPSLVKHQQPQQPCLAAEAKPQTSFSTGPSHVYHIVTFPNPQQPPKQSEVDLAARKRKRWNPEDMERAIFHVEKKNMSARAAAMMCNVPRSTLWDRLCQRSSYQGRSQKAKRRRQSLS